MLCTQPAYCPHLHLHNLIIRLLNHLISRIKLFNLKTLTPITSTPHPCLICDRYLIQHLQTDKDHKLFLPSQSKPAFKFSGGGVVFHEACLFAFLAEVPAPPVVVSKHVWQLRKKIKGWSGETVGHTMDRVVSKMFWNAEEEDFGVGFGECDGGGRGKVERRYFVG
jgi:hypothetical protein